MRPREKVSAGTRGALTGIQLRKVLWRWSPRSSRTSTECPSTMRISSPSPRPFPQFLGRFSQLCLFFTLLGQILPLAPGCLQTLHRNGTKNPALPLAEVAAPCPHSLSPIPVPAPCPLLANATGESGGPGGGGQQRLPSCHFQICFGFAERTLIK